MPARNALRLAFIGFGEVGTRFSRDLVTRPDIEITAYDILADNPATAPAWQAKARAAGVTPMASAAEACAGAM